MTTLTRVTGKVFGGNAPLEECGVFGSAKAGSPDTSTDIATIQSLPAYLLGWGSGVVSSNNFPPMEEVTGVLKTISYQACYLLQEGCPVYDINTEYSATSIVKNISGNVLQFYISKQDGNIGNSLTDTDWWQLATFTGTSAIGAPQFTLNVNATLPDNCIWLEGAEVSRTDYSSLFAIYGTTYGVGNGSTTFNLPDFRNRYLCGVDTDLLAGYVSASLPDLQLSTNQTGAHTHTRGTMNITGGFRLGDNNDSNYWARCWTTSGAFSGTKQSHIFGNYDDGSTENAIGNVSFDASRSWSGATSSNGAHTHTISSSNPIVGASTTVKTNGIKVRVYTRYI